MTAEEYFLNRFDESCVKLPEKPSPYLNKKNYLSEFYQEDEKALARSNLGITPLLEQLKNLIDSRVIDIGAVTWDLTPTEGHTESTLSSDALYKILFKEDNPDTGETGKQFYNRTEIDNKVQRLYDKLEEQRITVDNQINSESENPV